MKNKLKTSNRALGYLFIGCMFVAIVTIIYCFQVGRFAPTKNMMPVHKSKNQIAGQTFVNNKYEFEFQYPGEDCILENTPEFLFVSSKCPIAAEDIAGPGASSNVISTGASVVVQKEKEYSFAKSIKQAVRLAQNPGSNYFVYYAKYSCPDTCTIPQQWFIQDPNDESYYLAITGQTAIVNQIIPTIKF